MHVGLGSLYNQTVLCFWEMQIQDRVQLFTEKDEASIKISPLLTYAKTELTVQLFYLKMDMMARF